MLLILLSHVVVRLLVLFCLPCTVCLWFFRSVAAELLCIKSPRGTLFILSCSLYINSFLFGISFVYWISRGTTI
uniref:Uncharacterized protein n=1 Tax=Arundo donax TaxID=35708 RepID=A0A0A9D7A9_ARUDO